MSYNRNSLLGVILLLAASAVAFVWVFRVQAIRRDVSREYSVENIMAKADDPEALERLWSSEALMRLGEAERREVYQNKQEAYWRLTMRRVDEYFDASESERDAILDRHLAEYERQYSEKEKKKVEKDQSGDGKKGGGKQAWSRAERQAKSESANPDEMARLVAYKTALKRRSESRGSGGKRRP